MVVPGLAAVVVLVEDEWEEGSGGRGGGAEGWGGGHLVIVYMPWSHFALTSASLHSMPGRLAIGGGFAGVGDVSHG